MSTSWTLDQLADLEAAIAAGATLVKYQDKEVQYASLDEMMKIRDRMRVDLNQIPKNQSGGRYYPRFRKDGR